MPGWMGNTGTGSARQSLFVRAALPRSASHSPKVIQSQPTHSRCYPALCPHKVSMHFNTAPVFN